MRIDGFTVIAQIFNFLVLVVLLRLVLYKPVVKAMADRASAIEDRWAEAEAAQAEAKAEATEHREAVQRLDAERVALLTAARHDAEAEHRRLLDEAQLEAKQAQQEWREALEREQAAYAAQLRQQVAVRICDVARRALVDLADVRLEAQIMSVFISQVQAIDATVLREMGDGCRHSGLPVMVRTGFAVADEARQELDKTITALLSSGDEPGGEALTIDWVVEPELGCGVELETPGRQVRWSVDSYVDAVEQEVSESLHTGAAVG